LYWNTEAWLIAPVRGPLLTPEYNTELGFPATKVPEKTRLMVGGRISFRFDVEPPDYNANDKELDEWRHLARKAIHMMEWDAVLISDYMKGFLDNDLIRDIITLCQKKNVPVVVDAKRAIEVYRGASVLKCNAAYAQKYVRNWHHDVVVTNGAERPEMINGRGFEEAGTDRPGVRCVNHVGAGDAFAAALTVALLHTNSFEQAVELAHCAGRCYVQKPHNHPVWPHEVRRDLTGSKLLHFDDLERVRCAENRILFTNGVFRLPHAGHAWLLRWIKEQVGSVVVGINTDESARRQRQGYIMPAAERIEWLQAQAAVDWIIPFGEDTPCIVLQKLKPDILVKGQEYAGQRVPGDDLVNKVLFAPQGPYEVHSSTLEATLRAKR
jgi:D-beta-D-heptose 7-phosphate kinase/D-beta-D-heptose 1-phosphate adenosyltransferase